MELFVNRLLKVPMSGVSKYQKNSQESVSVKNLGGNYNRF
ncbi:MAG: hypothetical protein OFPII_06430 [Osedax symbiont Rs1]|nr:MAG: hypothetical protein OFPII_06430 [Osedax symbiont Rs1]